MKTTGAIGAVGAIGLLLAMVGALTGKSSAAPGTGPGASETPADDLTGGLNDTNGGPGGPDPNIIVPGQPGWAEGFMCTSCGKYFTTGGELNHHRAAEHFAPGTVTFCPYCDEMFFTSEAVGNNGYKMHLEFYHNVGSSTRELY